MITHEEILRAAILAVDDDTGNLEVIAGLLGTWGYTRVVLVSDPREAADRFALLRPDLVMLDLNMPHLDGFAVLERLRALEPDLPPVLVISGDTDREARLRALASGAMDFIQKPLEPSEARARIRNLIEARLLRRQVLNQNRELEERVKERSRELEAAQLEVVERLAQAAERRDRATGEHILRMSRYCGMVARAGGLDAAHVDLLRHASPLHDVGKIAIPDAILLKAGPLTDTEWQVMRLHTTIGAEMLADGRSALLREACLIARSHHERWAGGGYPDGLVGEVIPLSARICAICDVFDAMTSERTYHAAYPVDEVVGIIRAGRGTHFDPRVVDWFERALPEILDSRAAHGDGSARPR